MTWKKLHVFALPGTTYTCSGLSPGNMASAASKEKPTNPKEAALQVLNLCDLLDGMGVMTVLLPPHERPHLQTLRDVGFSGSDKELIKQCHKENPSLLRHVSSSAFMWMANSATFTPSADSLDGKAHITCANTVTKLHRSIEAAFNGKLFKKLFHDSRLVTIHNELPSNRIFSDEGSANHIRLAGEVGQPGLHIFVYGSKALEHNTSAPVRYIARQSYEASQAIARSHTLSKRNSYLVQQLPGSVDQGVFHNDLVACYNDNYLLVHEEAFLGTEELMKELTKLMQAHMLGNLQYTIINSAKLSLREAVQSYLFNSLLVTQPDGNSAFIATEQCREHSRSKTVIDELARNDDSNVNNVHYIDLSQSMMDGGGPACLQLRLLLNEEQLATLHEPFIVNKVLLRSLKSWVEKHYRDKLTPDDLCDPNLLEEGRRSLDELSQIFQLGSIYPYQERG